MMYPSMVSLLRQKIPTNLFKVGEQLIGQPKLDGIFFRLNIYTLIGNTKDDKEYDVSTLFPSIDSCTMVSLLHFNISHLIGELVYIDPFTKNITRDRSKVMDVLLKHQNYKDYLPYIKFVIFDIEFKKEELNKKTYLEGFQFLHTIFLWDRMKNLAFIPSVSLSYHNEAIDELYDGFNSFPELTNYLPLEGVVVKRLNSQHFQFRDKPTITHFDWFKIKNVHTATLRIIAIKPHSKDSNLIGSFIVTDADNILRSSIGSGLTKELRHMKKEEFLDKVIEVEYEALIEKTKSLVHPRFKSFREDDNVDSYEKLKGWL